MAYRRHTATPPGSHSPSPSSSTNPSPYIHSMPLDSKPPIDDPDSSHSAQGTPYSRTSSLPRTQSASKGGCWTCRVRRKKCDEVREGDSCKTCKRLTIKCLGWGPKRPDWMRDKKNVDAYKASIKQQLSKAGLIRGQPRNPNQAPIHRQNRHINLGNGLATTQNDGRTDFDSFPRLVEAAPFAQQPAQIIPGMPGASNSAFEHVNAFNEPFDPLNAPFNFQPSLSPGGFLNVDPLGDLFITTNDDHLGFMNPTMSAQYHVSSEQTAVHEELVMHFFTSIRKEPIFYASPELNDTTYAAVVEEPRGAVTLAISALADLHSKLTRVSQGLEAPDQTQENSTTYLRHEAIFKLESDKSTHGIWTDNNAIAALHLVSLSLLSGGKCEWERPFEYLCQWFSQTNLTENPWGILHNLTPRAQFIVKATMWLDIFISLSTVRPPKFFQTWKQLLTGAGNFWPSSDGAPALQMDLLTGCPDDAMLVIAETSVLAHWKATQSRNQSLSYPELIRRGSAIEQQLRRYNPDQTSGSESHPQLLSTADVANPTDEERNIVANLFREAAYLYLHTVLSNSSPGVPEIASSVNSMVKLFTQLPPSDLDRALVFPLCIAGSMTNDSTQRDFFKGRLKALNENYGNLLQVRRLMEAVWQQRDVSGKEVDVRETIREQRLNLLLI